MEIHMVSQEAPYRRPSTFLICLSQLEVEDFQECMVLQDLGIRNKRRSVVEARR